MKNINLKGKSIEINASMKPDGKIKWVKDHQNKNEKVMMIGDGINDAPALA